MCIEGLFVIVNTTNILQRVLKVGRPAWLLVHVGCSVSKDHIWRAIKCPVVVQIPHIPEIDCWNTPTKHRAVIFAIQWSQIS